MENHGPIYFLIEKEIKKLQNPPQVIDDLSRGRWIALREIKPEIDKLEQSLETEIRQLKKAYSATIKECAEEFEKYRWIPVTERLPENGQYVLVDYSPVPKVMQFLHEMSPRKYCFQYLDIDSVTPIDYMCWMPLPPTE